MSRQWVDIAKLVFKGERFRDHALDLTAIVEMGQFQKLVAETAKALWRKANPDRDRLPGHFQERTRLYVRRIEEGSAAVPLEACIEEEPQRELFQEEPTGAIELNEAVRLSLRVFGAASMDRTLPRDFPEELLPEYARFGESLEENEAIEVIGPGEPPTPVTRVSRKRLATLVLLSKPVEEPREGPVDITGEVLEADIRQRRFQVWRDENTCINVEFTPAQEDVVTHALRDHETVRLRVIGRGQLSSTGELKGIKAVEDLQIRPTAEMTYDASAPAIEAVLQKLASEVPDEEWERLPTDLIDNLDHYLYGTP